MTPQIRRDVVVTGILQYTGIKGYDAAETILARLAQVSATENTASLLLRLNTAKPGRCPCCGHRAQWGVERLKPDYSEVERWVRDGDPEE